MRARIPILLVRAALRFTFGLCEKGKSTEGGIMDLAHVVDAQDDTDDPHEGSEGHSHHTAADNATIPSSSASLSPASSSCITSVLPPLTHHNHFLLLE